MDERSERIARRFELPILLAALLVIPVIVLEQTDVGEPYDTIATVLNWAIWLAFATEVAVMLAVVPDRWRWVRETSSTWPYGIWRMTAVDPPTSLEFTDAFADSGGAPIADMPASRITVLLAERDGGTRMEMRATFESRDDMERMVKTGMAEGLQRAVSQMDALLAR
jgi:uncharacterized protein YndB with AHSA1/START domain